MVQLVIALLLFAEPEEYTPLFAASVGVAVAPAFPSMLQLSIVLLALLPVEKTTTPLVVEGKEESNEVYFTTLLEPPLINRIAVPPVAVLVFVILKSLVEPVPPERPSIIQ